MNNIFDAIPENLKAKVKFLKADIADYMPADSLITDKEIEDYYNANSKEFPNRKEQRNFNYVLFSTEMTKADSSQTLEDINHIILATGMKSYNPFSNDIFEKPVHIIGDANKVGKAQDVIENAFQTALTI